MTLRQVAALRATALVLLVPRALDAASLSLDAGALATPEASALARGECTAPVVKWEQLPDGTTALSAQDDSAYPFTTELADDFVGDGTTLLGVEWWGTYWNGTATAPESFRLRVYTVADTIPGTPVFENTATAFNEVTGDPNHYCALFTGDPFVKEDAAAYFLSVQAVLVFPPQWGWATGTGNGRECRFRSALFGHPDWVSATTAFGVDHELAFRLLNPDESPVEEASWGRLKANYR